MKQTTIKLPIRVIKEILHCMPRKEAEKLLKASVKKEVKSISAAHLGQLDGIASIGGDAVKDTEAAWQ